jgi:regulator of protease activity HflC (stomatin/prohibitin superfamily)
MATVTRYGLLSHLRAEPNQFVLHFRKGHLVRQGAGLAYWFSPLSAAVAQVPVEDVETTFLFRELSADLQEVNVQCTLRYRSVDPARTAGRVNFTISLATGAWLEEPLDRLASLWSQLALRPARGYLNGVPLVEAVRGGAQVVQSAIEEALRKEPELEAMGLTVVSVHVVQVSPSAELEKALQTPTREAIQQKADQASFERRALAVEKERAIKENELATEIELARRQDQLIRQQGANQLQQVVQQNEADNARAAAERERRTLAAESGAAETRLLADAEAAARRLTGAADAETEGLRAAAWRDAPARVLLGLALRELGAKVQSIHHLNITPDLLGQALQRLVEEKPEP